MTDLSDRVYRLIPVLTFLLLGLITASSFILSYVVLVELARDADIPPLLAPLWPLCLDFFMVCASLYVLRKTIAGEKTRYGWLVIVICTALSVIFNVLHAPDDIISKVMYAIPPAFVCVSFEMLLSLLHPRDKKEDPDPVSLSLQAAPLVTDERPIRDPQVPDPETPAARILSFIREKPGSSYAVIADGASLTREQVIYHTRKLLSSGLLVRTETGLQAGDKI